MNQDNTDSMEYPFPFTKVENERLQLQSQVFAPATRAFLAAAGIRRSMSVLDVGCGAGDVSALIAERVGRTGQVLGIDASPRQVRIAKRRFSKSRNMRFCCLDLADELPIPQFDAIVGRLVLMYLEDPVPALTRLKGYLRPGGIMAFQEADHSHYMRTVPDSVVFTKWRDRILEAAAACGVTLSLGRQLDRIFVQAGLPAPQTRVDYRIDGGTQTEIYRLFALTAESMWKTMLKYRVVKGRKQFPVGLACQLEQEAIRRTLAVFSSRLIGVWSVIPRRPPATPRRPVRKARSRHA